MNFDELLASIKNNFKEECQCQLVSQELELYFSGVLKTFKMPIFTTGTAFQQSVWRQVSKIPYGHIVSYTDIAHAIGKPKSVRAVANAVGANHWAIIIPCHRVIQKNGKLGGYAWGVERKKWLIDHEKKHLKR